MAVDPKVAKRNRMAALERAHKARNHPGNLKANGETLDPDREIKTNRTKIKDRKRKRMAIAKEGKKFVSIDWRDANGIPHHVKAVKKIVRELFADANIDSVQKRLLAERAAFVIVLIRNQETLALAGEDFDEKKYVSLVGKLQTILTTLGMENKNQAATDLAAHIVKKSKKRKPVKSL